MTERIDTAVIGAGQAGLATSFHLSERGREHLVLERGRIGETWRSQRWDGFVLNTPNWAQQLPGFHYSGSDSDGFAPLAEVIAYLEDYASAISAPVRESVGVLGVRRANERFLLETTAGALEAENVVVAAGSYQVPTPTSLRAAASAVTLELHTSEYRRPEQLPPGAVLVVGSGQSGCQIADELLTAGRGVYLSVGRCPWLPRRYRGRELMHWLVETGLADESVASLPSQSARLACNPPVSGNDGGHDCNPRWLARRGAILLGRVESIDGTRVRIGDSLAASLAAGDSFVETFSRRADDVVAANRLDVDGPAPVDEPAPVPTIRELDLLAEGIGSILWANGFRPDHSWIEGVEADGVGWPVHERGVSSLPGLYFVGLHWLHKRKSALFLGVGEDAAHVVDVLDRRRPSR